MEANLKSQIENASKHMEKAQMKKAEQSKKAGEAKGELASTKSDLKEDEEYKVDVETTHGLKKDQFGKNQEVRQEELVAIDKAIEIMSGDSVSGAADKHLPSLLQKSKKAVSLIQMRMKTQSKASSSDVLKKVSQMLLADASNSKDKMTNVSFIAVKMMSMTAAGTTGPLDKIVTMIEDLLTKLKDEAAEEAEHQGFCTKEMHDNKKSRESNQQEVDDLMAKSENLVATIAKLGDGVVELEKGEAALIKAMGEATEQRNAEKKKNTATIADAKAAQTAVTQAMSVLQDFYDKSGSFVQTSAGSKQVPEMKAYGGQSASSGGVLGMLEVILTDFARLESTTEGGETQASTEYDTYMKDAKADKKQKHEDAFEKKMEQDKKEHELHMTKKDLKESSKELKA